MDTSSLKFTGEKGPIYSVPLIEALPLNGGMMQAMPTFKDLEKVQRVSGRMVAGFEVLLCHYFELLAKHGGENDAK